MAQHLQVSHAHLLAQCLLIAVQDVGEQFQQGGKLPWLHWIFPSAKHNPTQMDTAWYIQHSLSPIAFSRPELAPDEDEEGMFETVRYLESLIDACIEAGIPANRVVLGGFSQGMVMSLLLHLTSTKYSGKLAGIVALLGYLPLSDGRNRIAELRTEAGFDDKVASGMPIFMGRGLKDPLVPKRIWNNSVQMLKDLGVSEQDIEMHEYEGLAHSINGALLRDLCAWLEKVVPSIN